MKKLSLLFLILLIFNATVSYAQDSLITGLAKNNLSKFVKNSGSFAGSGWERIIKKAKVSTDVLIGEDHFTNEIPYFVSALAGQIKFDNFFCEIDPFTASILQEKIKTLSAPALEKYVNEFGNTFSFYAFGPEFDLLKQFTKSNTKIQGTDQILLIGDRVICNELQKTTKNPTAKKIYQLVASNSKLYFDNFLKDQSKPFYLLTKEFEKNINKLASLPLSKQEIKIIDALRLSAKIYKSQSHHLRVQLMKNQLMNKYAEWNGKRNLFKYGANHLAKGEGFLDVYDIGNLVSNIDDSNYQSSLHIMILGISGAQASPFEGYPDEKIDQNSELLNTLKPITKIVDGEDWYCFDLLQFKNKLMSGKLKVNDVKLERIIKGYDFLVIIPKVTASKFEKKMK